LASFSLNFSAALRYLPSFPTRRSSDLVVGQQLRGVVGAAELLAAEAELLGSKQVGERVLAGYGGKHRPLRRDRLQPRGIEGGLRSEEHTSELQSLRHLVCRLLLEKKKK